jgi:CheY-like chemotaxis protein
VENGQLTVDAWRAGDFEVVFLDIQMPVMDGYEAARTIRGSGTAGGTVPIFALTAFTQNSDRVRALESGITDFLSKPIRARDINQLLQKHQLGQQKSTDLDFSTEK